MAQRQNGRERGGGGGGCRPGTCINGEKIPNRSGVRKSRQKKLSQKAIQACRAMLLGLASESVFC